MGVLSNWKQKKNMSVMCHTDTDTWSSRLVWLALLLLLF